MGFVYKKADCDPRLRHFSNNPATTEFHITHQPDGEQVKSGSVQGGCLSVILIALLFLAVHYV